MTQTHPRNNRGGMPSLAYGAAIAVGTTLLVITVQHFLLATKQPEDTRMDMISRAKESYLRNHPRTTDIASSRLITSDIWNDLQGDMFPSFWHDEFFSPLLDHSPLMKEMMKPAFKMDEDGDQVSLVMSVPDIPLKDIDIEVIGGRLIHIKGEKKTSSSHVSFDKRFSIGQHLNESDLKAKLTKDGDLVLTAPKKGMEKKDEVRKISIAEEL